MSLIPTKHGVDVDDALLQRREVIHEDAEKIVRTIEYCALDCPGAAHTTGLPDRAEHFCDHHVHRSLHVTAKRWPEGMGALVGGFSG